VDIDDEAPRKAGAMPLRDTVKGRSSQTAVDVRRSLDLLAGLELDDRTDAWR